MAKITTPMNQYTIVQDTRIPVGTVIPVLEAGFYELGSVHNFGHGFRPINPVSDDLIDIAGTPADDVSQDIANFIRQKDRFVKCGLTHKRGYLFWGPPGTGKTSIGMMIGRRFVEAGGVVFICPGSSHLQLFVNLIRTVEPSRPCMFLMEEAEGYLNDPTALSILDGEQTLAGAVFVAMTNHKERMPPRISNRPGRFDRVVYVGAPPYVVQVEYFRRLLGRLGEGSPDPKAEEIATALKDVSVAMGHLREAFISHVLLDVPLETVVARFTEMANTAELTPANVSDETSRCTSCGCLLDHDGDCENVNCAESYQYDDGSDE